MMISGFFPLCFFSRVSTVLCNRHMGFAPPPFETGLAISAARANEEALGRAGGCSDHSHFIIVTATCRPKEESVPLREMKKRTRKSQLAGPRLLGRLWKKYSVSLILTNLMHIVYCVLLHYLKRRTHVLCTTIPKKRRTQVLCTTIPKKTYPGVLRPRGI